ncbi:MAG: cyclic nucleotide-binding domain-containing protein [Desulfobacteraceae bacterium]
MIDFISNIPLFESLKLKEVGIIATYVQRQKLKAGEILFNQWDKAESVYFVEQGALEVLTKCGPEKYEVIATLRRGRSIGEMSLIDNFPRTATVRSKDDTALVCITRGAFEDLMEAHHELGIKIIKGLARLLAQNLRKTSSRLADNMLPMG